MAGPASARAMLARDTELRLVAASVLALSDRNAEALAIAREVHRRSDTPPQSRRVGAAHRRRRGAPIADHLGLIPELMARWPLVLGDPGGTPLYAMACLNARAIVGAACRRHRAGARTGGAGRRSRRARARCGWRPRLGRMLRRPESSVGWRTVERQPRLAPSAGARRKRRTGAQHDRVPACVRAGRRAAASGTSPRRRSRCSPTGSTSSSAGASPTTSCWPTGRWHGSPSAKATNDARCSVLESLDALAERATLPRLRMYSLAERIRIHALRHDSETIDALTQSDRRDRGRSSSAKNCVRCGQRSGSWSAIAKADAALARNDVDEAERLLDAADALAAKLRRRGEARSVMVLRSVVAWKRGSETAIPLLREAIDLATLAGDAWLLAHAHPLALEMASKWEARRHRPQARAGREAREHRATCRRQVGPGPQWRADLEGIRDPGHARQGHVEQDDRACPGHQRREP